MPADRSQAKLRDTRGRFTDSEKDRHIRISEASLHLMSAPRNASEGRGSALRPSNLNVPRVLNCRHVTKNSHPSSTTRAEKQFCNKQHIPAVSSTVDEESVSRRHGLTCVVCCILVCACGTILDKMILKVTQICLLCLTSKRNMEPNCNRRNKFKK